MEEFEREMWHGHLFSSSPFLTRDLPFIVIRRCMSLGQALKFRNSAAYSLTIKISLHNFFGTCCKASPSCHACPTTTPGPMCRMYTTTWSLKGHGCFAATIVKNNRLAPLIKDTKEEKITTKKNYQFYPLRDNTKVTIAHDDLQPF